MSALLQGVGLKLRRAHYQLQELDRMVDKMVPDDACTPFPDLNAKGNPVVRVKNVPEPDPGIGVVIGDIAHNFRSALDHLIYCLSTPPGASEPRDPEAPAFPIVCKSAEWQKVSSRRLKQARRGTKTRVERLQPYHRRKHPENWVLWQLYELSNIDKHRLLHVAPAAIAGYQTGLRSDGPGGFVAQKPRVRRAPLKENAIAMEWPIKADPGADVEVEAQFTVGIAFDGSTPSKALRYERVLPLLVGIGHFIGGVVVQELAPLLDRDA